MKATNLLLIAIVSILGISCSSNKKVIYANEVKTLNENQQSLIEHTKNTFESNGNNILLPAELNVLLGDSVTSKNILAQPIWENAYFVKDEKAKVLVVPMKANHNDVELCSDLIVAKKDKVYSNMVSTYLECKNEATTEYIQIESSTKGEFYNAKIFDENNNVVATYGIEDIIVTDENRKETKKSNSLRKNTQVTFVKSRVGRKNMDRQWKRETNRDMEAIIQYDFRSRDRSNTK